MSHDDSDDSGEPVRPPSSDPFERARAALRDAQLARGLDPDAETEDMPIKRDVESVLQRAAAVREQAAVGRAGLEREARAREELARLKAGGLSSGAAPSDPPEEAQPKASGPRPRRL